MAKKVKIKNVKVNKRKEKKQRNVLAKKTIVILNILALLLIALLFRIAYIQFVKGNEYKEMAYRNQTLNKIISPKRGTIFDSTGKALAMSADVDTVTINPGLITVNNSNPQVAAQKTKELKESVAKAFSDIFSLNYTDVLNQVNSTSSVETIIRKVEQDKIDQLTTWMKSNNVYSGINIDADTKRYYPYNNLASNLIGFCGTDNQGLEGLELKLDNILTGTSGKIVSAADSISQEIPNTNQLYIPAENGSDVVLSLDYNVQSIVEKYLKQAVEQNKCKDGGNVIVMNPQTGDILAMATYPNYNLNSPFTINSSVSTADWDKMNSTQKSNALYSMWKNISVTNGYEPGSVFKILTASIGLDENVVSTDTPKDFFCSGSETVDGVKINCWRSYNPHGYETLRQAFANSCNPAFIQLGQRIGVQTFYKYLNAFGLFDITGADVSGEVNSNFLPEDKVGPVELATLSFGQRFTVTPLQMITAICSVVNDGILVQPRVVKQIINTDTGTTTDIPVTQVRQVISKETSEKMKSLMKYVVTNGTGIYAKVPGYTIGGKSGTSEPAPGGTDYVASFAAIAPLEDTQVCILLTLYGPSDSSHEGGAIAAPVVSKIFSEVLPYLGIAPDNEVVEDYSNTVLPNVTNKTLTEAINTLTNAGFNPISNAEGDKNTLVVTDQVPKSGVLLSSNSEIYLYTSENEARTSVTVPNLKGKSLADAKSALQAKNLNIMYNGSGKVSSQDIASGKSVEPGTIITVTLK
ncbi:MAG: penicillin-binding transpeptidase domain-containing protein [Oscillospiraceae bacterium]|nr:penicillin-binding transpeptidase domain-containing protein [Oscillospiraceae bacterium]